MAKQLQLSGYEINLRKELGEERYQMISNHLETEVGYNLDELQEGIAIIKMDFGCAMHHILTGLRGCYIPKDKQLWLRNTENSETIVHEFVHVAQRKRTGVKNSFKAKLTTFANIMMMAGVPWFYRWDYYEEEARQVAAKYLRVNNIQED